MGADNTLAGKPLRANSGDIGLGIVEVLNSVSRGLEAPPSETPVRALCRKLCQSPSLVSF